MQLCHNSPAATKGERAESISRVPGPYLFSEHVDYEDTLKVRNKTQTLFWRAPLHHLHCKEDACMMDLFTFAPEGFENQSSPPH